MNLQLACGDRVRISLFGGQVLSWYAGSHERLFTSPTAVMDGSAPIRAGVPICFPQFNKRGDLPKHGFARTAVWALVQAPQNRPDDVIQAVLGLRDSDATRAIWPHAFEVELIVTLSPGRLKLQVLVRNTGETAFDFACALHTYFAIDGLASTELQGLERSSYWNALTDEHLSGSGQSLRFTQEFDSVFQAPASAMLLQTGVDPVRGLRIAQSDTFTETVVWNPHAALCAKLADMPRDGYEHMLCVEAAKLLEKTNLPVGKTWSGCQTLSVV